MEAMLVGSILFVNWRQVGVMVLLYVFLGINRIEKRAKVLVAEATPYRVPLEDAPRSPADLERELGSNRARLVEHARVVETVTFGS